MAHSLLLPFPLKGVPMKNFLLVPMCFLLLTACGSDNDNHADSPTQAEQPASQNEEENSRFTVRCRLATPVEGSNFQYEWSARKVGDLLEFDTTRNRVRVNSTDGTPPTNSATYTVSTPTAGTVGSQGSLRYEGFSLSFPVIPYGTVQGSTRQYLMGSLNRGSENLGDYLCGRTLQNELRSTNP